MTQRNSLLDDEDILRLSSSRHGSHVPSVYNSLQQVSTHGPPISQSAFDPAIHTVQSLIGNLFTRNTAPHPRRIIPHATESLSMPVDAWPSATPEDPAVYPSASPDELDVGFVDPSSTPAASTSVTTLPRSFETASQPLPSNTPSAVSIVSTATPTPGASSSSIAIATRTPPAQRQSELSNSPATSNASASPASTISPYATPVPSTSATPANRRKMVVPLLLDMDTDKGVTHAMDAHLRKNFAAATGTSMEDWKLRRQRAVGANNSQQSAKFRVSYPGQVLQLVRRSDPHESHSGDHHHEMPYTYLAIYHANVGAEAVAVLKKFVQGGNMDKELQKDASLGDVHVRFAADPAPLSKDGKYPNSEELDKRYPPLKETTAATRGTSKPLIIAVTAGVAVVVTLLALGIFGIVRKRRRTQTALSSTISDLESGGSLDEESLGDSDDERRITSEPKEPPGPTVLRHQTSISDWQRQAAEAEAEYSGPASAGRLIETDTTDSAHEDLDSVPVSDYDSEGFLTDTESVPQNSFVKFSNF